MTARGPLLEAVSPWAQTWLRRLLASLAVGVCVGMLVFVFARGVGGIILFIQQQDALRDGVGILGGGFDQPPPADLRAIRRRVEALDLLYWRIGVLLGLAAAVFSALSVYVRLERQAARVVEHSSEARRHVE
ncbi:MAG TPA: hypothetical protein VFT99_23430 [Roseiflexaceae bacterium]|nr:hypothetical protein [Roseiflexaceae bacterium]